MLGSDRIYESAQVRIKEVKAILEGDPALAELHCKRAAELKINHIVALGGHVPHFRVNYQ
ncbi:hypothetical protein GCM10027428_20960 [Haliea atlantica]